MKRAKEKNTKPTLAKSNASAARQSIDSSPLGIATLAAKVAGRKTADGRYPFVPDESIETSSNGIATRVDARDTETTTGQTYVAGSGIAAMAATAALRRKAEISSLHLHESVSQNPNGIAAMAAAAAARNETSTSNDSVEASANAESCIDKNSLSEVEQSKSVDKLKIENTLSIEQDPFDNIEMSPMLKSQAKSLATTQVVENSESVSDLYKLSHRRSSKQDEWISSVKAEVTALKSVYSESVPNDESCSNDDDCGASPQPTSTCYTQTHWLAAINGSIQKVKNT